MERLNFEDDKALADQLSSLVPSIRDRRRSIVERWLNIHSAWKGAYVRSFFKSETFQHYVPYFRRVIEKFTVRGAQMVLPTNEFFEVHPANELDEEVSEQAESVKAYLFYLMRKRIRIYSITKQLFRCLALYGRAILRTGPRVVMEDGRHKVWPSARVVDPFMFCYWPENAPSLEEAQIVIEDAFVPFEQYKAEADAGRVNLVDPAKLCDPTWPDYITRRLQSSGLTEPRSSTPAGQESKEGIKFQNRWVFYSEVWLNFGPDGWKLLRVVWNLEGGPLIVKKLSTSFTRPMYRMTIGREIPGEQYTSSMGDDQEPLQVLLNDQVNMLLEGVAIQQCPPAAIDVNRIGRANSLVYRPRALWRIDPEGVKWMSPEDTTKISLQGVHWTSSMMDTFSGSSPLAEGQPIRNMPRAGFAVSSLLNMSVADIRDVARSIEEDILTPMLHDLYGLTVKFVPESQVFNIPGTENFPARRLTITQLEGDWDFNWVGSLQTQDFQQLAQRLDAVLMSLGKLGAPLMAQLQAQGKQINWVTIFKWLWRYGVGIRGPESIITDIPMTQNPVDFAGLDGSRSRGFTGSVDDVQGIMGMMGQSNMDFAGLDGGE